MHSIPKILTIINGCSECTETKAKHSVTTLCQNVNLRRQYRVRWKHIYRCTNCGKKMTSQLLTLFRNGDRSNLSNVSMRG